MCRKKKKKKNKKRKNPYLARKDMAAVLAMVTTLEMFWILELVCKITALPELSAESSAACQRGEDSCEHLNLSVSSSSDSEVMLLC